MFTAAIYTAAALLLILSLIRDKDRTGKALVKSWSAFENILPQFLLIILLIGITLAVFDPEDIEILLGSRSGWIGMLAAAIIGSATLIPGFVAFPLTAALWEAGAGLTQIAVFICTLMAVGVVTLPVEIKYFGVRVSIIRNVLAFIFSFIAAMLMGEILT